MNPADPVDIICTAIWSLAIGLLIGAHWTRKEWIKACRAKKLIRFDSATGDLIWVDDKTEVP